MKNISIGLMIIFLFSLVGCDQLGKNGTLKFSGTLELTEHSLGARTSGRLASLLADEGSLVKKGELIGTLDRYDQAKKDFERAAMLVKEGGATQQSLEYATLTLEDQQIISPVNGVVLVKVHEAGEMLTAGSPVVVVGDRENLWVRIYVPEGLINKIQLNQPASLRFDGLEQSFNGHVSFVASRAEFTPRNVQTPEERITQTFAVKVALDNPPDFIRPGVACDVAIQTK